MDILKRTILEGLQKDRRQNPLILSGYGYKCFSQNEEDGIIAEIFRRIGGGRKTFIEIGVGNGLENNTLALLYSGWKGAWVEGSAQNCAYINVGFAEAIESERLDLIQAMVTPENINEVLGGYGSVDLLSVDIDGNDAHVLAAALKFLDPRVIVVEYNAKFGPSISYCMKNIPGYTWEFTDQFGASLKYFEMMLRGYGYCLVGCNLTGSNAFFVKHNDTPLPDFLFPFTSEVHYEPARYELSAVSSGHACSYTTFRESL